MQSRENFGNIWKWPQGKAVYIPDRTERLINWIVEIVYKGWIQRNRNLGNNWKQIIFHSAQRIIILCSEVLNHAINDTSSPPEWLVLLYLPFQRIFSEPSLCLCTLDCRSEGVQHGCGHSEHRWGKFT